MNYCSFCGGPVVLKEILDDHLPRFYCEKCDTIHYQNPKVVVGCLPIWEDKVLLCKRAIEPMRGYWNIPAGYLENGETVEEGAAREVWEEALARVTINYLLVVYSIKHINQVYILFVSELKEPVYDVGVESLDVRLFSEEEIPWKEIAFNSSAFALKRFFENRKSGTQKAHMGQFILKDRIR